MAKHSCIVERLLYGRISQSRMTMEEFSLEPFSSRVFFSLLSRMEQENYAKIFGWQWQTELALNTLF